MENKFEHIKSLFSDLSENEKKKLLSDLNDISAIKTETLFELARKEFFENEVQKCPHCESKNYIGYGIDKGSKRFKCKECKRTFTEYTGTWLARLHDKHLAGKYVELLFEEKGICKISEELDIAIQTSFNWRHKFLSAFENIDTEKFKGVTESDEAFFLFSEKGKKEIEKREPRHRGGKSEKRGISNEQVAVIVTADRKQELDLKVATMGRIKRKDIENAIGNRIGNDTILCTDCHVSYKSFALSKKIEHHTIKASIKEYVKEKVYHVQTVNSLDSRLKPWINIHFRGVATKYLQNYLNWFKFKQLLKKTSEKLKTFLYKSFFEKTAWRNFKAIEENYEKWVISNAILE